MYSPAMDPTAVQSRRMGAWLIDFVFAGILFAVGFMALVDVVADIPGNVCGDDAEAACTSASALAQDGNVYTGVGLYDEASDTSVLMADDRLVWPFVLFVGYGLLSFVVVEGLVGGSLGKLMLGLRVVRADGNRAGVGRSALRFLLWAIDGAPWCFPLVGLITGLTTKGHRRLGDMAAGTFVVGVLDAGKPVSVPGLTTAGLQLGTPGTGTAPGTMFPPGLPGQPTSTGSPWPEPATTPGWAAPTAPGPTGDPTADDVAGGREPVGAAETSHHDTGEIGTAFEHHARNEPVWDPERDTYVQWDTPRQCWLIWDTDAERWTPLDR
jgi:uncharacterized RDD family membrane protein YckC